MSENSSVILKIKDKIAILKLGSADEKIAVLNESRMTSLVKTLAELKSKEEEIDFLVISGASPSGFCAGADLSAIESVTDPKEGVRLATRGQDLFNSLSALKFPKIALIRGACVGGGCEMVLACNYRVLVDVEETKIGLPEVKLGILPGFGGTQRLPRLIGLPNALDIILNGKLLNAKQAYKVGLASYLLQENSRLSLKERFEESEKECIEAFKNGLIQKKKRKVSVVENFLTKTFLGRTIVKIKATATLNKETKGHYPAPYKALQCTLYGLSWGTKKGYKNEAKELGNLIPSSECKSLVHLFKVSDSATKIAKSHGGADLKSTQIGVVGAGVMGAGIAASFIARGFSVVLVDAFPEALHKGRKQILDSIAKRRSIPKEKKKEIISRLHCDSSMNALRNCGLVIEAIIEDLNIKKSLLTTVKEIIDQDAIIATNTSSLSVNEIAASLGCPERVVGMHFFNPVEKMPLVEIIRGEHSSEKVTMKIAALVGSLGKYPIIVEDVPGFLVNRVLTPYLTQAAVLLSEGFSIEKIDRAALKFGMPMGPIRLLDEVGLDVAAKVAEVIGGAYGERMQGPNYAAELLKLDRKGKKNNKGFYLYENGKEVLDPEVVTLLKLPTSPKHHLTEEEIAQRLILPLINEAICSLDQEVAGVPGKEASMQIDLGSVMGFGFAPFRGGIIFYAEKRGAKDIFELMKKYQEKFSARYYQPCEGIEKRAKENISFYQAI